MSKHHKIIIIGSGPAGLTAAIYLARAKQSPVVFSGPQPGGQLTQTSDIGNYPGFVDDIQGSELMVNMRKQAERFGTAFVEKIITSVDFSSKPFKLFADKDLFTADCVIIATGAKAKWLGLSNEERLKGKGVSGCATCDGFFFKDKDVVVVGGGDTAMEDATFLTKFAKSVMIVHRGGELTASKIMQERAKANPKISFTFESEVIDVLGEQTVSGVKIKNKKTDQETQLVAQGLFVAIGHKPNTDFLKGHIELDRGYIKVTDNTKTSIEGVFAGGDVHDYRYRQAVTAAGLGCMAALDAEKFLEETQ